MSWHYTPRVLSANHNLLEEGWVNHVTAVPVTLTSPSVLSLPLRHSRSTCPNWWYHQAATICSNARRTLPHLFFPSCPPLCLSTFRLPPPSPTTPTPPQVPPLRPSPRRRNVLATSFLLPGLRRRTKKAWSATSRGTRFSFTRTGVTGVCPSSRPAGRPRSTRARASVHLTSARRPALWSDLQGERRNRSAPQDVSMAQRTW